MQYKPLINPSFPAILLEVQDYINRGWKVDESNYPVHNFIYFEVNMIKEDEDAVKDVFIDVTPVESATPAKKAGRPPQNKAAH